MVYFVRVVKGNVAAALRELNRQENVDGMRKIARNARFFERPGQVRRKKREQCIHRAQTKILYDNLATVFKRKARGF